MPSLPPESKVVELSGVLLSLYAPTTWIALPGELYRREWHWETSDSAVGYQGSQQVVEAAALEVAEPNMTYNTGDGIGVDEDGSDKAIVLPWFRLM